MPTKLRVECTEKSVIKHWTKKEDGSPVLNTAIKLFLGYSDDKNNPNYPFCQLSGGTTFVLQTINEDAAAQFVIGKNYDVLISAAE